ncbi:diacylglycerol O-acyltransferase [Rhodococcus sp. WMMA185]|uniref:WS/DGAT/MGAT family O-acyltransferase n=1 Tax=Rhodococcus sp. WMMA185 TaxID=679318 RepID=UPI0008786C67|nr:wax ester/triacylglycerol synthase family O-acyltransferase [Rhodococcus sp. WMMA185]AOW92227.1 diacylglycerol O-acyltransferase [Rhodococcus sp. WMMA185]
MVTRLSTQDASFYFLETSNTPMHVGSLATFRKPSSGLSYEELLCLVEERLRLVPRYRQKVREVALGLSRPVWVDDRDFDIEYHIRRSALPKPGSDEQLHELVARLTSRRLDETRPLWEMYLVEGLSNDRFAIFTKSHASLVDGESALDISQVIFDSAPTRPPALEELWMPARPPSESTLIAGALAEMVSRPGEALASLRITLGDMSASLGGALGAVSKVASVVRAAAQPVPETPLNAAVSRNRRFAVAKTELGDYRKIRARYGCEVNDVILAVITGALRNWLLSRGEPVTESTAVRTSVPMSVYAADLESDAEADIHDKAADSLSEVSAFLVDLPVGEPNPVIRLSHIAHATEAQAIQGRRVPVERLMRLVGFAPATLQAMGARAASTFPQWMFNLTVTNAPGPQMPLYVGGARMLEMYPVAPLQKNQTLSIALTSYDGDVYYGLNADRDAMADVDVVAALIHESLEELLDASR